MIIDLTVGLSYLAILSVVYSLLGRSFGRLIPTPLATNHPIAGALVTGYLLFTMANTILSMIPWSLSISVGICLMGTAAFILVSRNRQKPVPNRQEPRSLFFLVSAMLVVALFITGVGIIRFSWIYHLHYSFRAGSRIWDDMRTIGFPLSLAIHGLPLQGLYNPGSLVIYPVAPFLVAAGFIQLFPYHGLAIAIGDSLLQVIVFTAMFRLVICQIVKSEPWRMLCLAGALFNCSYSLTSFFSRVEQNPCYTYFFGYYTNCSIFRTIPWTTLSAAFWIPLHLLGAAMGILLVIQCTSLVRAWKKESFVLACLLGSLLGCFSMDMAFLTMGTSALIILIRTAKKGRAAFEWLLHHEIRAALPILLTGLAFMWTYRSLFSGVIDSPDMGVIPILFHHPQWNLGNLVSAYGLYLLPLLVLVAIPNKREWIKSVAHSPHFLSLFVFFITLNGVFLAVFYPSIWFWRSSVFLQLLYPMIVAMGLDKVPSGRLNFAAIILFSVALIPGVAWCWNETKCYSEEPPCLAWQSEVIRWIRQNTPLDASVVYYNNSQHSFAADVAFFRMGFRAGELPFDRNNATSGYRNYLNAMSSIEAGIKHNDYIVVLRDDEEIVEKLIQGGRAIVFQNDSLLVFGPGDTR